LNQLGAGIAITGSGSATPEVTLDNNQLSQMVETSDEWITTRTGIRERHIGDAQSSLSAIATTAAERAIAMAGIEPTDLDLILLATSTPDDLFGTACKIQNLLGA
jgi:3-oxoacyl-[acyl-carrier-protein] synthase III